MCCWYTEYSQSTCLIHLSTAHDALSPHPWSYSTPLTMWECALPVLGCATAAWWSTPHTAPGTSSRGKAAAEEVGAEGPEGSTRISQGWLWWWWFRLEPAHSWSSTGPYDGKHIWWQWHGMGGQHYGLSLCLPQVQLGRGGNLVCCWMSLLLRGLSQPYFLKCIS